MTPLAASEVLKLALGSGMSRTHANVMTAISWYESRWDSNATGDLTLSHFGSIGLWQIFTGAHNPTEVLGHGGPTWTQALVDELKAPVANAHAARVVLDEQGYRAWSTYNTYGQTASFKALVDRVAALPDPNAPAPVPDPVAPPAPAPAPTVTLTLVENSPGVWSVKA